MPNSFLCHSAGASSSLPMLIRCALPASSVSQPQGTACTRTEIAPVPQRRRLVIVACVDSLRPEMQLPTCVASGNSRRHKNPEIGRERLSFERCSETQVRPAMEKIKAYFYFQRLPIRNTLRAIRKQTRRHLTSSTPLVLNAMAPPSKG